MTHNSLPTRPRWSTSLCRSANRTPPRSRPLPRAALCGRAILRCPRSMLFCHQHSGSHALRESAACRPRQRNPAARCILCADHAAIWPCLFSNRRHATPTSRHRSPRCHRQSPGCRAGHCRSRNDPDMRSGNPVTRTASRFRDSSTRWFPCLRAHGRSHSSRR